MVSGVTRSQRTDECRFNLRYLEEAKVERCCGWLERGREETELHTRVPERSALERPVVVPDLDSSLLNIVDATIQIINIESIVYIRTQSAFSF